jgi:hypothetical protein
MFKINDHWGIVSTPVADPETFKIYCLPWISPDGSPDNAEHHIVELDLRSGNVLKSQGLNGLTYDAGVNTDMQTWKSHTMRKQRSSLLMTNIDGQKMVFWASGSVLETAKGASGWIVAYDCKTSMITATLAMTNRYYGGGIWMAGQGLAADSQGFIYGITGNGSFDGITDFSECCFKVRYEPPAIQKIDVHGSPEAFLGTGKLTVVDWWSPYSDAGRVGQPATNPTINYKGGAVIEPGKLSGESAPTEEILHQPVNAMPEMDMSNMEVKGKIMRPKIVGSMAWADEDLGSSGVALVEGIGCAVFSGKDGVGYVADMHNLGKTQLKDFANPAANYAKLKSPPVFLTYYPGPDVSPAPQKSSDLDFMYAGRTHHQHATPVIFNNGTNTFVFNCGENGNVRAWSLDKTGRLSYLACSAEFASWLHPGMAGGFMCLTANGTKDAVLWVCLPQGDVNRTVTLGNVFAYDGTHFDRFSDGSGAMSLLWKSPDFVISKFLPPIVSGGRLFIATYDDRVLCFGLA